MSLRAISLRVATTVLIGSIPATVGLASSITSATGNQNWYTPYGGPGAVNSLGPVGLTIGLRALVTLLLHRLPVTRT